MIAGIFAAGAENLEVLFNLFLIIFFAKLLAEIFERLKQPAVVGEILAGVIFGPSLLGLISSSEIVKVAAEVGVIFLLFTVGLETNPSAVLRVGRKAIIVAILGVVVPFVAGYALMKVYDGSSAEAMFLGAAMVATSVGITARVLSNLGLLDAPTAKIILAAAVIDDILGLLILTVVSSVTVGGVDYGKLFFTASLAIGFTLFVVFIGAPFVTKISPKIERLKIGNSFFIFGLLLCLGLSVASAYIGVAAIIGAFLAGMALAEGAEEQPEMIKQTNGITEFLVPIFLVNIGMALDVSVFKDYSTVLLAVVVTVIAMLTKIFGCGIGALDLGWRRAGQVGIGMMPRGEVGIVVAQIGLGLAVIDNKIFGVVLFMAVMTTLAAPPLIKWIFSQEEALFKTIDTEDAGGIVVNQEDWSRLG
ncbi:MAG: cation:proton antiporter [Pyrinomonadaceae bacterium]|nr:cation:proton antiporter [Pyrinomonadaceae bacterium]MCX7640813.1 cation:proton antiporter [Pyrinomonadaceae bacterium]MDW8303422.1 cation:proton antiporter [Acidobacteriota bacterium]